MLASALILASALSVFQDNCPPIVIGTSDNFVFDITWPTGEIGTGSDAAFSGFGRLSVNGIPYIATECFELVGNTDGQTVITPPLQTPDGLIVKRRIYVPMKPHANYVRYYDRIENTTTTEKTVLVEFGGAIGLPGTDAAVIREKPGWCIINAPRPNNGPLIGWIYTHGLPLVPTHATTGDNYYSLAYPVHIKPGASVAIVNFIFQAGSGEPLAGGLSVEATPVDDLSDSMDGLQNSPDYSNLTSDEKRIIVNFFIDTDVNMDGRVNILDLIVIRNDLNKTPDTAGNPRSDVNHDLRINILDLILTRNDLGWPY